MSHRYTNRIIVTGEEAGLQAFKDAVAGNNKAGENIEFFPAKFAPFPEEAIKNPNWPGSWEMHEWKTENWGPTNIFNTAVDGTPAEGRLVYYFDSSDGEMLPKVMKNLSKLHREVVITYFFDGPEDLREGIRIYREGKECSDLVNMDKNYTGALLVRAEKPAKKEQAGLVIPMEGDKGAYFEKPAPRVITYRSLYTEKEHLEGIQRAEGRLQEMRTMNSLPVDIEEVEQGIAAAKKEYELFKKGNLFAVEPESKAAPALPAAEDKPESYYTEKEHLGVLSRIEARLTDMRSTARPADEIRELEELQMKEKALHEELKKAGGFRPEPVGPSFWEKNIQRDAGPAVLEHIVGEQRVQIFDPETPIDLVAGPDEGPGLFDQQGKGPTGDSRDL